jgi:hypothetical protein
MLAHYNELKDTQEALQDAETQSLNAGNAWLDALAGNGPPRLPYLKEQGRLQEKPKVVHVSAKQRRAYLNGK